MLNQSVDKNMFIYATWESFLRERFTLVACMEHLGWKLKGRVVHEKNMSVLKEQMKGCQVLLIWNGYRLNGTDVTDLAKRMGLKIIYSEVGYLPQAGNVSIDDKGLFCNSSINSSIDWITDDHVKACKEHISQDKFYKEWVDCKKKEEYILCVGQMEWDAQVTHCGNMTNFALIENCVPYREKYSIPIKFRPHPRMMENEKAIRILKEKTKQLDIEFLESDNKGCNIKSKLLFQAKDAKVVVGMNSTSLIDAMAINKPAIALIDCPLKTHINDKGKTFDEQSRYKLLAAFNEQQYFYTDKQKCLKLLRKMGF
jgi:hypothetical protein